MLRTDPLRKLPEVAVDVWVGQKGPPRAGATAPPAAMSV